MHLLTNEYVAILISSFLSGLIVFFFPGITSYKRRYIVSFLPLLTAVFFLSLYINANDVIHLAG